ncbi:MAG: hypothetical protein ABIO96_09390 [Nitrospiraceae bacterium]
MNGLRRFGWMVAATWLLFSHAPAHSEPYVPADDRQVLERLRVNSLDPVMRDLRALRTGLSRDPENLDVAAELATRYIEVGRSEGDPRFLGQAQAVLSPWWDQPAPPPRALLLRAIIRQNAHEFDPALADVDAVLQVQPTNAQAWLTKASILQVQGRYEEARRACLPLMRLTARHIALTCLSDIAGMTGQAARSREVLTWAASQSGVPDRERLWVLTALAELSARTGQSQAAEQYFADARRIGIKDQYLWGAYADFLLDQGRAQDVVRLLEADIKPDGFLLRLALAEQAQHLPVAKDHTAMLAARFSASRDRGTRIHLREEARFTLVLLASPRQALTLAQANWEIQKEPWDARLLLESALASGNLDAAKPVLEWLRTNQIEDIRLRDLAVQMSKRQQ